MVKKILPTLVSLIPWILPSIGWQLKLIITLFILIIFGITYFIAISSELKRIKKTLEEKEMENEDLKTRKNKLNEKYIDELKRRESLAKMYGKCEQDSDSFISDVRSARQDLYNIWLLFNQIKTRKNAEGVAELKRITDKIDSIIERESNHGRERSI
ncbi:hypothetical protein [Sporosarcina sp. ITBMC105]